MTWIMWLSITFSYYSFFVWIPGLLVESGMSMTKSFGYSLAIYCAQVPGYFSAAWFNEKIGRQATIASYMLLAAGALGLALAKTDGQIMLAGIIMSFFNGTYAGVYAYTAEVFPTAVHHRRGLASAIGRLGAIASPVLVGYLYPKFGFLGVRHHHGDAGAGRAGGAGDGRAHARPLAGSHRGGRGEMSGARPFRPAVAVPALNAVARAHEAPSQPQAVFAAVDHALAGEIGHRLFTILSYDPDSGVATRLYEPARRLPRGRQQDRDAGAVDRHGAGARRMLHRRTICAASSPITN